MQHPISSHSVIDHETNGTVRIWQAVILQALMDASANGKRAETQKAKREARLWLEGDSADFLIVCENACLCPDYVRNLAKHLKKQDYQWRTPPGEAADYAKRGKQRYAREKQWAEQRLQRIQAAQQLKQGLEESLTD